MAAKGGYANRPGGPEITRSGGISTPNPPCQLAHWFCVIVDGTKYRVWSLEFIVLAVM